MPSKPWDLSILNLGHTVLLFFVCVGPGNDGIMVIWKDNFDSHYSEVAELGRCVLYADLQSCLCQNTDFSFKN